ncbi:MAG: anaerobic ribonucleoside-triphosphate reductase activating protein [Muribaculaceae bacterium]|nr:anaerobic ribonucleoside-triphosphate reductase activating protein [Muribaculaceae bacterium]
MNDLKEETFQVLEIIRGTTVDGPGFRTSIYLAGCDHHCQGCHNPQSWDENSGKSMTLTEIMAIVEEEDFDVTISGGDPLHHPQKLAILVKALKNNRRNVWIYTGYTWEEIISNPILFHAIKEADVLVDGPYIESLRNIDIPFRGSENQRIISIPESLEEIVLVKR